MSATHAFFWYLTIGVLAASCCHAPDPFIHPEGQQAIRYLYFDQGSWWEFSDSLGNVKRFSLTRFDRKLKELDKVYNENPFSCAKEVSDMDRFLELTVNEDGIDTAYLSVNIQNGSRRFDIWNYVGRKLGHNAGGLFFNSSSDTLIQMDLNGISIDSVRKSKFSYTIYDLAPPRSSFRDSATIFLAPDIGPVLFRFSDGHEWKLKEYHVLRPYLN